MFNLFRRSAGHYRSSRFTAARSHVDDVIGVADHIQIMLNDNNGGALFNQRTENGKQRLHIQRVQTDSRFIKYKYGIGLGSSHLACSTFSF